ncbi:Uncharacterised protein [Segatella copri]|nr:Uncharacterised protein [Segatella copri]
MDTFILVMRMSEVFIHFIHRIKPRFVCLGSNLFKNRRAGEKIFNSFLIIHVIPYYIYR